MYCPLILSLLQAFTWHGAQPVLPAFHAPLHAHQMQGEKAFGSTFFVLYFANILALRLAPMAEPGINS